MRMLATIISMLLVVATVSTAAAEIKIGLNAPRGEMKALEKWGQLATYLEAETGEKVTFIPNKVTKLLKLMEQAELDFVFANPAQTIVMKAEHGVTPLVTLEKKNGPWFAGVIIAKKGSGISKAADLKGKKVISLGKAAAGAYIFQTYHLIQQGIDPHKDFAVFTQGKRLDDLVLAVNAGMMDAAFIKTGILESMAKDGKIKKDDFVIVDQRQDSSFSPLHTTTLYPNWYFSATKKADAAVAGKVKNALLKLSPTHDVCKKAKIKGFVDAISLNELKDAMKTLKLRPFDK